MLNQLRNESAGTTQPPTDPSWALKNPKVSHTRARKYWWVVLKYFKKLFPALGKNVRSHWLPQIFPGTEIFKKGKQTNFELRTHN